VDVLDCLLPKARNVNCGRLQSNRLELLAEIKRSLPDEPGIARTSLSKRSSAIKKSEIRSIFSLL
jgi:hypothetical protein